MNIKIHYTLSEAGRKASIKAGGTGQSWQCIEVAPQDPDFDAALDVAEVSCDGQAAIKGDANNYNMEPPCRNWDRVPTVAEILADLAARRAAKLAQEAEKKAAVAEATRTVLRERRVRQSSDYFDGIKGDFDVPDWPRPRDLEVSKSEEALAWEAELEARKEAVREEAKAEAARLAAQREEEKRAARSSEELQREALGLTEGQNTYAIEDGALTECPCWQSHKRGKNWMATIEANPASPGGYDRSFFAKANGDSFYLVGEGGSQMKVGEAVEFGADYYTGSGKPDRKRWYGFVVRIVPETDDTLAMVVLQKCANGKAAIKGGKALATV